MDESILNNNDVRLRCSPNNPRTPLSGNESKRTWKFVKNGRSRQALAVESEKKTIKNYGGDGNPFSQGYQEYIFNAKSSAPRRPLNIFDALSPFSKSRRNGRRRNRRESKTPSPSKADKAITPRRSPRLNNCTLEGSSTISESPPAKRFKSRIKKKIEFDVIADDVSERIAAEHVDSPVEVVELLEKVRSSQSVFATPKNSATLLANGANFKSRECILGKGDSPIELVETLEKLRNSQSVFANEKTSRPALVNVLNLRSSAPASDHSLNDTTGNEVDVVRSVLNVEEIRKTQENLFLKKIPKGCLSDTILDNTYNGKNLSTRHRHSTPSCSRAKESNIEHLPRRPCSLGSIQKPGLNAETVNSFLREKHKLCSGNLHEVLNVYQTVINKDASGQSTAVESFSLSELCQNSQNERGNFDTDETSVTIEDLHNIISKNNPMFSTIRNDNVNCEPVASKSPNLPACCHSCNGTTYFETAVTSAVNKDLQFSQDAITCGKSLPNHYSDLQAWPSNDSKSFDTVEDCIPCTKERCTTAVPQVPASSCQPVAFKGPKLSECWNSKDNSKYLDTADECIPCTNERCISAVPQDPASSCRIVASKVTKFPECWNSNNGNKCLDTAEECNSYATAGQDPRSCRLVASNTPNLPECWNSKKGSKSCDRTKECNSCTTAGQDPVTGCRPEAFTVHKLPEYPNTHNDSKICDTAQDCIPCTIERNTTAGQDPASSCQPLAFTVPKLADYRNSKNDSKSFGTAKECNSWTTGHHNTSDPVSSCRQVAFDDPTMPAYGYCRSINNDGQTSEIFVTDENLYRNPVRSSAISSKLGLCVVVKDPALRNFGVSPQPRYKNSSPSSSLGKSFNPPILCDSDHTALGSAKRFVTDEDLHHCFSMRNMSGTQPVPFQLPSSCDRSQDHAAFDAAEIFVRDEELYNLDRNECSPSGCSCITRLMENPFSIYECDRLQKINKKPEATSVYGINQEGSKNHSKEDHDTEVSTFPDPESSTTDNQDNFSKSLKNSTDRYSFDCQKFQSTTNLFEVGNVSNLNLTVKSHLHHFSDSVITNINRCSTESQKIPPVQVNTADTNVLHCVNGSYSSNLKTLSNKSCFKSSRNSEIVVEDTDRHFSESCSTVLNNCSLIENFEESNVLTSSRKEEEGPPNLLCSSSEVRIQSGKATVIEQSDRSQCASLIEKKSFETKRNRSSLDNGSKILEIVNEEKRIEQKSLKRRSDLAESVSTKNVTFNADCYTIENIEECSSPRKVSIVTGKEDIGSINDGASKKMPFQTTITKETQFIEEFSTEALGEEPVAMDGWSFVGQIGLPPPAKNEKFETFLFPTSFPSRRDGSRIKKPTEGSYLWHVDNFVKRIASERRVREYERQKDGMPPPGGKDFQVVDVWGDSPVRVRALTNEGEVLLLMSKDMLENKQNLCSGCLITIYPPWDIMTGDDDVPSYLPTGICDVICEGEQHFSQPTNPSLSSVPAADFINKPNLFVSSLLAFSRSEETILKHSSLFPDEKT